MSSSSKAVLLLATKAWCVASSQQQTQAAGGLTDLRVCCARAVASVVLGHQPIHAEQHQLLGPPINKGYIKRRHLQRHVQRRRR